MPKLTNKERRSILRAMGLLTQLGLTVVVCVALGVFLGNFLDNRLGTSPLFLIIFSLLGCASAFKTMYDLSKKF